eukprot:TRINITY_DN421_c0_g1_i1.p3 TRINITY_DN421_c0_g1~~TRINITY_DN421_c0_g1_i1.p3  ORF type:complete len:116 (+),score=16.52 TRINITY_DN421_c0_g1_i1:711-1058(+)
MSFGVEDGAGPRPVQPGRFRRHSTGNIGIPSAMMLTDDGRDDEDEEDEDDLDLAPNDDDDDDEEDDDDELGDSPAERLHRSRSCGAVMQGNMPTAAAAIFDGMGTQTLHRNRAGS